MFNRIGTYNSENLEDECFCLFKSLKQTVEWLLAGYSPNIWNTYGSLSRLCSVLDEIFMHGLLSKTSQKYWEFLSILLSSHQKLNITFLLNTSDDVTPAQLCHRWLEKSLLEHNLSTQLQMLLQDEHHISQYYKKTAFLQNKSCTNALLLCLRAVERNQPSILTDLDPLLIIKTLIHGERTSSANYEFINSIKSACDNSKDVFETSSSLDYSTPPESFSYFSATNFCSSSTDPNGNSTNTVISPSLVESENENESSFFFHSTDSYIAAETPVANLFNSVVLDSIENSQYKNENFKQNPLSSNVINVENVSISPNVPCTSSSINEQSDNSRHNLNSKDIGIYNDQQIATNSSEDPTSTETCSSSLHLNVTVGTSEKAPTNSWKAQHSRSKSDGTAPIPTSIPEEMDTCSVDNFSSSLPSIFSEDDQNRRKSIFEGDQIIVSTECFFPRPHPGQTLTSFLSSKDFNICAELDKENAHFFIAEALISAIEQVKCEQTLKQVSEEIESDEEIKELTQRIRIRRREKMQEKAMKSFALLSDGKTDTTTSQSASPKSSTHSSDFDAESIGSDEDEIEDIEISECTKSNLNSVRESGLSLSMASLYSDADFKKASVAVLNNISTEEKRSCLENNGINLSAEAIALSLLKRFSEKQLPKASDLQWLISEEESGQKLLPLPDSWPVSPDSVEEDFNVEKIRLRGNLEWAPPRLQIIFDIQPEPKRKIAIQKQNYRCAGCGMKIEKSYIKKFRYCEYLGKFFCQCCHSNDLFYIPARILRKWEFRNYYVSKFAWKLLDQMYADPLFNVAGINCSLYKKVRQLDMCREYRTQLFYLKDFIRTCRKANVIQEKLDKLPLYVLNEPDVYSISDFLQVKNGEFSKSLSTLVSKCISHVTQCILCRAKGFICEMCQKDKDIIFPFQLLKVVHCSECGSCVHKKCHEPGVCLKCNRIKARKQKVSLEQENRQQKIN